MDSNKIKVINRGVDIKYFEKPILDSQIENIINKDLYPKNKEDLKIEDDDQGSALGSIGLKPKIVH